MKRTGNLIASVADPDNLRLAFWKAAKGKRYSREVLCYQEKLEENLLLLRNQLLEGKISTGHYRYFTIFEPKKRLICASAFGEQVMHHALMNICHPYFERAQVHHSYASRPGKGTHAAIAAAQRNTGRFSWFLKLDISKFFESIHHKVLKTQLSRLYKDPLLLSVFNEVIDSYKTLPGRGLPIGNLTSQYFANHFLAGLDHYILELLHIPAYVRYMDDMVLWHHDRNKLKEAHKAIHGYVEENLCCALKPELLNRSLLGLPFLGYRVFNNHLLLTQRSKQRFIKKLNRLDKFYHTGQWSAAVCQQNATALLNFIGYARTAGLRKTVFLTLKGQVSECTEPRDPRWQLEQQ